jgi:acetyl-CoA carboxylase biotin carboxylase subunit
MLRQADAAMCIGPAAPAKSYLNQAALLFAAEV